MLTFACAFHSYYLLLTPVDGVVGRKKRTKASITVESSEWELTRGMAKSLL